MKAPVAIYKGQFKPALILLVSLYLIPWQIKAQNSDQEAEQYMLSGREFQATSQYDSALWYFNKAKDYFHQKANWEGYVWAENGILEALLDQGTEDSHTVSHYQTIKKHYEFAVKRLGPDHDRVAQTLAVMGMAAYAENNLKLSVKEFDRAIKLYEQNHGKDYPAIINLKTYQGIVLRRAGQYPASKQSLEEAKALLEVLGRESTFQYAKCLMELAVITEYTGDLQEAYKLHKIALVTASDTLGSMHKAMTGFYINASTTSGFLGHFDEAVDFAKKSIAILEEHSPNAADLGTAYLNLGVEYYYRGYLDSTEELWNKALEFYLDKGAGMEQDQALVYNNLSVIYNYRGDFEKAINFTEKAMSLLIKSVGKDHPSMIYKHFNLSETYMMIGELDLAEDHALRAIALCKMAYPGDHKELASAYGVLSEVYTTQEKYDQAHEQLQLSTDMFKRLYPDDLNQDLYGAWFDRASLLRKERNYTEAVRVHHELHELGLKLHGPHAPTVGVNLGNLAYCLVKLNQVDSALQFYQQALTFLNEDFKPTKLTQNPTAEETYIEYSTFFILKEKAAAFWHQFKTSGEQQYLLESWNTYQDALALMSEMRKNFTYQTSKEALNQDYQFVFEGAIEVSYAQYQKSPGIQYFEQAFNLAEKSKAVSLLESFKDSQAKSFAGMPNELVNLEREVIGEFTYAKQQVASMRYDQDADSVELNKWQLRQFELSNRMDSIKAHMEQQYPRYFELKYDQQPLTVKEVQTTLLDENQVLIEYFLGDSALFIFTITPDQIDFHRSDRSKDINQWVDGLREVIARKGSKDDFQNYAHELYKILIEPIGVDLGEREMIIIPDGILQLVPFDLLIDKLDQGQGWNNLPYLFNKHQTSYAYSTYILKQNQTIDTPHKGDFLAFAPDFNGQSEDQPLMLLAEEVVRGSLVELKGALQEILAIRKYLPGAVLKDSAATESRFKLEASRYGVLHLATHAIVDDVNPMNSKLLFTVAGDSLEDGDLHVWELYNMNLQAQMAVLSACNTGYGKLQRGEGVMSIGRAFAYAGCPSVVMSLWPAQDKSTSTIMNTFYKYLALGHSKDESLKLAKQQYLAETEDLFTHPFYWAGFVVQGDTRPLQGVKRTSLWWVLAVSIMFVLAWVIDRKLVSKI